jgi:hypothetical protein
MKNGLSHQTKSGCWRFTNTHWSFPRYSFEHNTAAEAQLFNETPKHKNAGKINMNSNQSTVSILGNKFRPCWMRFENVVGEQRRELADDGLFWVLYLPPHKIVGYDRHKLETTLWNNGVLCRIIVRFHSKFYLLISHFKSRFNSKRQPQSSSMLFLTRPQ